MTEIEARPSSMPKGAKRGFIDQDASCPMESADSHVCSDRHRASRGRISVDCPASDLAASSTPSRPSNISTWNSILSMNAARP